MSKKKKNKAGGPAQSGKTAPNGGKVYLACADHNPVSCGQCSFL
jgi:hypothetical protein